MSRHRSRTIAVFIAVSLALTACGNSGDDDAETSGDSTTTTAGDGSSTTAGDDEGDSERDTFVPIEGVPGVTDEEIAYTVVGTKSGNPLGTCILDCYVDGVEAYFAYRNSEGGIYGRDLVVNNVLDDEVSQNQVRALDVIAAEDAFGSFQATLLASGWGDLDAAGIPTYAWGIHATEYANRPHIFPSAAIRCSDCTGRTVPYIAQQAGATTAATMGYGITENSRVCANTTAASIDLYSEETGVETAIILDNVDFGMPNGVGPEVTQMKEAGVDFIATCIDLNGMKTLATELQRQGMDDVVLYHPNTYNQAFVAEAGDLFEGDYVLAQFLPFEAESEGTALVDFLEWIEETGSEPSELAMVGWLNATLAYEGLLAAGPEFDRQTVTDATLAMTAFDAGGLIEPIDWTTAHTPYTNETRDVDPSDECGATVQVVNGEFETLAPPETPWLCFEGGTTEWGEPTPTSFG